MIIFNDIILRVEDISVSEQKSHKTQIIVALIGAIAIIIAATIGVIPKLMESSAEIINPKINKTNSLLSNADINNIVSSNDKDAKELSRKYYNKEVFLKGNIVGSYKDKNYMVVWVETNNIKVGCLSAPDNKKLTVLRDGEKATIKGVIHHLEPHSHSSGIQIILARGCMIDKELTGKNKEQGNKNSSTSSVVKMPLIPEGTYRQTSVKPISLGECPQCEIIIKYQNKDTIKIESNNDWFGYARYDKNSGLYKGTSEYLKGRGGNYKDTKSNIVVFYDKNVITIDSSNEKVSELIQRTFQPQNPLKQR